VPGTQILCFFLCSSRLTPLKLNQDLIPSRNCFVYAQYTNIQRRLRRIRPTTTTTQSSISTARSLLRGFGCVYSSLINWYRKQTRHSSVRHPVTDTERNRVRIKSTSERFRLDYLSASLVCVQRDQIVPNQQLEVNSARRAPHTLSSTLH
jgi:hypothetical protein